MTVAQSASLELDEAIKPVVSLLESKWTSLGVDAIDLYAHGVDPNEDAPEVIHYRVDLHSNVETGIDAHLSPFQASLVHSAIARGDTAVAISLCPADVYPLAHAALTARMLHPHAASVIHFVSKHTKHIHFLSIDDLESVFARLENAALLFGDMHAMKPDSAQHAAVDAHPKLTNRLVRKLPPAWTLLFRRPL